MVARGTEEEAATTEREQERRSLPWGRKIRREETLERERRESCGGCQEKEKEKGLKSEEELMSDSAICKLTKLRGSLKL